MRKFFRALYYAGFTVIFIIVAIVGYTQTRSFRNSLQSYILSHYQSVLKGQLSIGRLEGNLVTGIRLYDVSIRDSVSEVFKTDLIEASYDPLALAIKHLSLSTITVLNPRVVLTRSAFGGWNVSDLIISSSDTTPSAWVIALKNVVLVNAHIELTDSLLIAERVRGLRDAPPPDAIDYARIHLDSVNVEMGLRISSQATVAQVRKVKGALIEPRIVVREFQGNFKLAKNEVSVSNVKLETARSRLRLDAMLSKVDLATVNDLAELKSKPVQLNLQAERLDTRELKQFLYPWVDFLDKTIALQLQANGEFGNLNIAKVSLQTTKSLVIIGGTLTNLHRPKNLELNLSTTKTVLDPNDVLEHVPGLNLPNLESLGKIRLGLTFRGTPSKFHTTLNALTDAGDVVIDADLVTGGELEYKTTFATENLDLGRIFDDEELRSRLRSKGSLTGSGTSSHSITAVARVEIDSSEFYGMPLGQSVVVLDLSNGVIRSHVQLRARSTRCDLSGIWNNWSEDSVSYSVSGSIQSLNLADIIRSEEFKSELSMNIRLAGSGKEPARMNHAATINFLQSSFGSVPFDSGKIGAVLDLRDSQRSIFSFKSNPIDLNIEGTFTLPSVVENVILGERIVSEAITYRIESLDSLTGTAPPSGDRSRFYILAAKRAKPLNVGYRLNARNLYPVGVFFQKNFAGTLSMEGTIKGSIDGMDFHGEATIPSFGYRNTTDLYRFERGTLALDLKNIARSGGLDSLFSRTALHCEGFSVNTTAFYHASLILSGDKDSSRYEASAFLDSTYQLDLRGTSAVVQNIYAFDISQLRMGMDSYIVENVDPIVIKAGRDGFNFQNFLVGHEVEELNASGYLNPGGLSDFKVSVNSFLLTNLKSLLYRTRLAGPVKDLNGILNANLSFSGSFDEPNFSLDLTSEGFRSKDLVFGQVVARSTYANRLLSLFVELRNEQRASGTTPDLLVSGTVPYDLGLTGRADRTAKGEMNLTMFSKGLNMELLSPFLPVVSKLSGTLMCDTKIRGSVSAPSYEGSVTFRDVRFVFDPLGISYVIDGRLVPSGNRIGLDNLVVRNIASDRTDGLMNLTGTFKLAGFKFQDFDFRADGQLLVMKEASRLAGQKFYGDLFVATGSNGVRWQGLLANSRVSGDVLVKNGRITLPPEREAAAISGKTINVIFIDDTSAIQKPLADKTQAGGAMFASSKQLASLTPMSDQTGFGKFEPSIPLPAPRAEIPVKSFLDNITYELNIEAQGPTSLRFVFNMQTSEELYAYLKGKLVFNKNASQTRLTGEVDVENRSYYNFFKRFDASGKLKFTGDPLNPELDITARYEGVHTLGALDTARRTDNLQSTAGKQAVDERVAVILKITGTKNEPKPKFDLEFPGKDKNAVVTRTDVESDAISFLVTGFFKDELTQQQQGSYLSANMLSSLTAGLITGPLTNALKKQVSAIQSVDLQYYGGDWNKTDVRVTAEIRNAVIRFGGRVIEGLNNTNVTVEIPVGSVVGYDQLRNLLFRYERKVDSPESVDLRKETNGLSMFYRIIF